jgi:hypothetical protein
MNLSSLQQYLRPPEPSGWQALVPVITVLLSGLVIILEVSPAYLRELHPLTLLLLSVASALPVWALNQLLWWNIGRSVSGAIVEKMIYVLEVPEQHRRVYSFAFSELLKAVDILRFVPYQNLANLLTVISIYVGAAVIYVLDGSVIELAGCIVGLSLLAWVSGLLSLHLALRRIDVEPLRGLWHQLRDQDELLAAVNSHFERMESLLRNAVGQVQKEPG